MRRTSAAPSPSGSLDIHPARLNTRCAVITQQLVVSPFLERSRLFCDLSLTSMEDTAMDRRRSLKLLSAAVAAPRRGLKSLVGAPYQLGTLKKAYTFFNPAESEFIEAAVARLIPYGPARPGCAGCGCTLLYRPAARGRVWRRCALLRARTLSAPQRPTRVISSLSHRASCTSGDRGH